jgi:hypothetical protein
VPVVAEGRKPPFPGSEFSSNSGVYPLFNHYLHPASILMPKNSVAASGTSACERVPPEDVTMTFGTAATESVSI